ncbi:hypothetical protein IW140_004498 [Coemansia sp. RSA 1813]|nr:hypothetical protein EV178_004687 [Coemansia sp. RSA 1646]KAJ1771160.1 hypothetical protein LPJ74_002549 [Coemansia sp. RSA 1843]KAJ2087816.1 hypothetical protein IW138_004711 [Coemansia sp. RSA 986]KAJ2212709.1 hypothetical protein EV179_004457 [Coemansia sp. RSA 487]KAJ2567365.1 hypothetical protein IW140_004498 [Coemansia sp. RSA 1813]
MSSYTLRYFPIAARAETTKVLLTLSGADWKLESPAWPQEKDAQPVGKVPVLIESSSSASSDEPFVLGESLAIEQYLAAKHGFYFKPDDLKAVARQNELRSHIKDINDLCGQIKFAANEEAKDALQNKLKSVAGYVTRMHEKVLKENGSNGHYFGSETTYVDIAAFAGVYSMRSTFYSVAPELLELFSEENTPGINKVYKKMLANPSLASYSAE